ncbi:hypothetical protein BHE90_015915 [Fusarium euwallaceae]|uniref:Uncharacterized protein n=2 Tax=Fusarium solani species complex TaxID=232080 RepID=A0A3M2R8M6_9HYPO|nr:hypothetical protein CDV36_015650 [Fusarium kuroshium]RTE69697.1 hypothetical protein BHE90_015915 [Fusarium euwallaceae]
MSKAIAHDGYTHFTLSPAQQRSLDDADELHNKPQEPDRRQKVVLGSVVTFARPLNALQKATARNILRELYPYIVNWPDKEACPIYWRGIDVILEKGGLETAVDKRSIIIPRPFPSEQKVTVGLQRKEPKLNTAIEWKESEAYMLEAGVLFATKGGPIRAYMLRFCRESEAGNEEPGDDLERLDVSRDP